MGRDLAAAATAGRAGTSVPVGDGRWQASLPAYTSAVRTKTAAPRGCDARHGMCRARRMPVLTRLPTAGNRTTAASDSVQLRSGRLVRHVLDTRAAARDAMAGQHPFRGRVTVSCLRIVRTC